MKKLLFVAAIFCAFTAGAFGGSASYSGKEMNQSVQQAACTDYYGDTDVTLSAWGAYVFAGGDDGGDLSFTTGASTRSDMVRDPAAGGGVDLKYFFRRNWGIGVEGFGLGNLNSGDSRRRALLREFGYTAVDSDGAASALLTLTYRFPLQCSRWSPYVWGGLGGLWGANDSFVFHRRAQDILFGGKAILGYYTRQAGDEGSWLGQAGVGMEYRFGRHFGSMVDLSWNIADEENFGMVRGGFTFSF